MLKDYTIQQGFALKKTYNKRRRIKVVCRSEGCPFHLHATIMVNDQSYQIRIYEDTHTCLIVQNNLDANSA